MSLILELSPEIEQRLNVQAAQKGLDPARYVVRLLEQDLGRDEFDLEALLALPRDEQERLLAAAAEDAAPLYEADLKLPPAERELTAFTALDEEEWAEDA